MAGDVGSLTLYPVTGTYGGPLVADSAGPVSVGRAVDCEFCLMHEAVSRRHATLMRRAGEWFVVDLGGAAGTAVNGVRLQPRQPAALVDADLVRFGPCAFRVMLGRGTVASTLTIDDAGAAAQRVERVAREEIEHAAGWRLSLLTECAARLNSIIDEASLAQAALEAAIAGTGFARGAVVRPIDGGRGVEVLATRGARLSADDEGPRGPAADEDGQEGEFRFSRSLIQQAAGGQVVRLMREAPVAPSVSIQELRIHSAICAPVRLGESIVAYLYLDARGQESSVRTDAAGFSEAVARVYGLAMANAKRVELERRQQRLGAELTAAREAQQLILPPAEGVVGGVRYAMQMRPGLFVAGDLFDVVPLDDGRVAVFLGDVTGAGIGSAILMASSQAYLNAQLRRTSDPAEAMRAVNRYVSERSALNRFVSLWVGVFAPGGEVSYVDAGHGHWLQMTARGPRTLARGDGIPVGIDPDHPYQAQTLTLEPGERIVVYSDGIVEQKDPRGEQFGLTRLREVLATSHTPERDVAVLFEAVTRFAGSPTLDDDSTAASIAYETLPP